MWGHRHSRNRSIRNTSTQEKDPVEDTSKVESEEEYNSYTNGTRFSHKRMRITGASTSKESLHSPQPWQPLERDPRLRHGRESLTPGMSPDTQYSDHLSGIDWRVVREGVDQVKNNLKLKELTEEETGHLVKNFRKLEGAEKKRLLDHMRQLEKIDPEKLKRLKTLMHGEKIFDDYKKTKQFFLRKVPDVTTLIQNRENERKEVSEEVLILEEDDIQVKQKVSDGTISMEDAYDDLAEEEVIFMINNFKDMDSVEKPHLLKYLRKLEKTDLQKYRRLNSQRLAEKHGGGGKVRESIETSNKKEETEFITLD